ncbi:unnamed protein product [Strongylus vulgaris]|uniref:Uncharacterized protein n=1 Tax=Strongylus vulgaris TaxID=40348 RepID=A0A3P7KSN9_STRVU|nr:unnamed protein product [Strongylus vulgaris]
MQLLEHQKIYYLLEINKPMHRNEELAHKQKVTVYKIAEVKRILVYCSGLLVMIGELTPPSVAYNEAASSPMNNQSRRSTFDDDAFFSAPRSKSEARTRPMLSPQQIFIRQMRVSIFVGLICAFTFVLSLVALQFSVPSIFRFFGDAISTVFAVSTWVSAIIVGLLSFGMSWALLNLLVKGGSTLPFNVCSFVHSGLSS